MLTPLHTDTTHTLPLATPQTKDLPKCVDLLHAAFYKDALTLAKQAFSPEELERIEPPLRRVNGLLSRVARASMRAPATRRLRRRLRPASPPAHTRPGDRPALMRCALAPSDGALDGVVELSLEPRDGLVPGDLRLPLLVPRAPRVPYISNLAVREAARRQGVGSELLLAAEAIARGWGYTEVYLHAASAKSSLRRFYTHRSYRELPEYDAPRWVLATSGREPTTYMVRQL